MQCARCGAGPAGADLFDWCGLCGQKLCDECMAAGCCGMFPAFSGRSQDHSPYEGCCEAHGEAIGRLDTEPAGADPASPSADQGGQQRDPSGG